MIEHTLAHLGKYLADTLSLDTKQIIFTDREHIFHLLSKDQLPAILPAVSYYCSGIEDPQQFRAFNGNRAPRTKNEEIGSWSFDLTKTTIQTLDLIPVNLNISVGLLAANVTDYFFLMKGYYHLLHNTQRYFQVHINSEGIEGWFNSIIDDQGTLTTPARGQDGWDFDRGKYYVWEGDFRISSYLAFEKNEKVIRRLKSRTWFGVTLLSEREFKVPID